MEADDVIKETSLLGNRKEAIFIIINSFFSEDSIDGYVH
jgi:hypothetical protein